MRGDLETAASELRLCIDLSTRESAFIRTGVTGHDVHFGDCKTGNRILECACASGIKWVRNFDAVHLDRVLIAAAPMHRKSTVRIICDKTRSEHDDLI